MKSFRKIKNKEQNEDFIWNATEFEQRAKRVGLHGEVAVIGRSIETVSNNRHSLLEFTLDHAVQTFSANHSVVLE
ncbi:hypothetical protein T08_8985 [Trichinella sp. T8]|nr:hypothetical protein T08_8985 [Trichinella sp. T8]